MSMDLPTWRTRSRGPDKNPEVSRAAMAFVRTVLTMNEALLEEDRKIKLLRFIIDLNQAVLMQQVDLTLREAFQIMRDTRQAVLNLFPDKESVYELIYAPRFRRIIRERFVLPGGRTGQR